MEMMENCTIFSMKIDGTRAELNRTEIRKKVTDSLRKRSSARKEYDKEYHRENRDTRLVKMKQHYQENETRGWFK